jgi:hypothetical protein
MLIRWEQVDGEFLSSKKEGPRFQASRDDLTTGSSKILTTTWSSTSPGTQGARIPSTGHWKLGVSMTQMVSKRTIKWRILESFTSGMTRLGFASEEKGSAPHLHVSAKSLC